MAELNLSSYLGAGIGDESVTLDQHIGRVEWGINDQATRAELDREHFRTELAALRQQLLDNGLPLPPLPKEVERGSD